MLDNPNFNYEQTLWGEGYKLVCGVDEVGKGAWAGPLTVAVAIPGSEHPPAGIKDSKMLTEKRREELFDSIVDWCAFWSTGSATSQECDTLGMSLAQKLAAQRALENLGVLPDWALVDGRWNFLSDFTCKDDLLHDSYNDGDLPRNENLFDSNDFQENDDLFCNDPTRDDLPLDEDGNSSRETLAMSTSIPVTTIIKGDTKSLAIAAASILGKVTRDRQMREVGDVYGPYRFRHNKGYRCNWHVEALKAWGATPIHRTSWSFMEAVSFA